MNKHCLVKTLPLLLFVNVLATACTAGRFYGETYDDPCTVELGIVQKNICEGMFQDEIAMILGTPNIVTADKDNRETWIYDKIATEVHQSGSRGLILFCQTGADYVCRTDVSQKTLTVVIKFDHEKKVDCVSYHASKF